jgi:serine protease
MKSLRGGICMYFRFLLCFFFLFAVFFSKAQDKSVPQVFVMPENINSGDYDQRKIIVKIKPEFRQEAKSRNQIPALRELFNEVGAVKIEKKFPEVNPLLKSNNERGDHLVDLSLIYEVELDGNMTLEKVINSLYKSPVVEYAEPFYIPVLLHSPNDPDVYRQYALQLMKAFDAWQITKGDTNVIIGITDTGIDFDHEDLKNNVKFNYNDPINGIDDDGDGYVDNFMGWDLGSNDNNPQVDNFSIHGPHVSGIAAATTNNQIGIAGVAYNCKFLPVKISNSANVLTHAYEGIIYAANMGCHIINCSWGSPGGGRFGQDVINYATFNKGALVVAAAGNSNKDEKFYPAAYENTLSVAATNSADQKWTGSNYGYFIDVCAPGDFILSAGSANGYTSSSGTSMAAPNAAGAAALVKSVFPDYSPLQIKEQLKVTADDVYNVNENYTGKLGAGRINIYRAVTETGKPSVVLSSYSAVGRADDNFIAGDTILLFGNYTNYLAPASNVSVNVTALNNYVKVEKASTNLGPLTTFATASNATDPFKIRILKNAPVNAEAVFKVTISSDAYSADYFITLMVNVDYVNLRVNDIKTTISGKGRIGYNKESRQQGLGLVLNDGHSLLYEMGLIMGSSPEKLSSSVRGAMGQTDDDFSSILRVEKSLTGFSDFDLEGKFNDKDSKTPVNVLVNQNTYTWRAYPDNRYFIQVYDVINKSNDVLNNFYVGLFADWDIMDYSKNKIGYDAENKMGYTYSSELNGKFGAIKLLSKSSEIRHYAIDNVFGGNGGVDLSSGFEKNKKYFVISNNRHSAGSTGEGNDVIDVVSAGPFNLNPGDTASVAFAIIAGNDLAEVKGSARAAQVKFDSEIPKNRNNRNIEERAVWLGNAFPNPSKASVTLEFYIPEPMQVNFTVFNNLGQTVKILTDETAPEGLNRFVIDGREFNSGLYFFRLQAGDFSKTGKFTFIE